MSRASEFEFIRAKADLIEKYFKTAEAVELKLKVHMALDHAATNKDWRRETSASADQELSRRIDVEQLTNPLFTPSDAQQLFKELRDRFGYSHLGGSPLAVVRRVLKRKAIRSSEEYYKLKELLDGAYPAASSELSEEQQQQIWQIVQEAKQIGPKQL